MKVDKEIAIASLWMLLLRLAVKGLGLVSTVILVRLLSPEDFGLVAIAMSFIALINIITSFGFDTVLIQKQKGTNLLYDTAWSLNISFGLLACLITTCMSGTISTFYGNTRLQPLLMTLSLLFLITGSQNIGVVDFRKNMTFDKEFKFQIFPKLVGFFATIGMAIWLRSYWALVFGTIIWKSSTTIMSYIMHAYRPTLSFASWRELSHFSKWLMVNNFIYFINSRSPELILGKFLLPQAVGLFTIAQEISTLPTTELTANISRAAFPGYSKVSSDLEQLKAIYLKVMGSISFFVLPAGVGLASIAGLLVPVFLGEKWLECVALIRYLSIGGLLLALNSNTGYVFLAIGQPKMSTIVGFCRIAIFIPLLIIMSMKYGLLGAAQSVLLTTIAMFVFSNLIVCFRLDVALKRIFQIHYRPFLSSIFMCACIYLSQPMFERLLNNFKAGVLASCILIGIITYSLAILLLWLIAGRPDGPENSIYRFIKFKMNTKPTPLT